MAMLNNQRVHLNNYKFTNIEIVVYHMVLSFCYSVEMTITYITWSIFHGTKPSLAMSNFAANTEQGSAGSVVELAWLFCGSFPCWQFQISGMFRSTKWD